MYKNLNVKNYNATTTMQAFLERVDSNLFKMWPNTDTGTLKGSMFSLKKY